MQVFVNLWGGEGYLTSASLLAMASLGMFDNIHDVTGDSVQMFYRCLDFADESPDDERWRSLRDAMNIFYPIVFKKPSDVNPPAIPIISDGLTINSVVKFSNPPTLAGKYPDPANLSLGCSETDMGLDITNGIYGKPWVGEAFHSDSFFSNLYTNAEGNIAVVNCGGYKGGGTAATFIPLENGFDVSGAVQAVTAVERFNVIAGPSTEFFHTTRIPNPGIYAGMGVNEEVDLFDIPEVIEKLSHQLALGGSSDGVNQGNIDFLRDEYKKVKDLTANPPYDYSNLNPKFYMSRFIDRINSDSSMNGINASFINIKPNLSPDGDSFKYDVTSKSFTPDCQSHDLHITNLLNALSIQEIMLHHDQYAGGKIYTFGSPNTNKFTVESVFLPEDAPKFYRFIILTTILTKYVYSYFDDITRPGADLMLNKWAAWTSNHKAVALSTTTPEGIRNNAFANTVKRQINDIAYRFLKPVLSVFMDIENTSNDVEFFSKTTIPGSPFNGGTLSIMNNLLGSIHEDRIDAINDPNVIKSETEKIIAAIAMGKGTFPDDFMGTLNVITDQNHTGTDFLRKFQDDFPEFGGMRTAGFPIKRTFREWDPAVNDNNVAQAATDYCNRVIGYTYDAIENKLF